MPLYPKLSNRSVNWRQLLVELVVVFVGVTAAFLVENIREERAEMTELRQASVGMVAELRNYRERGVAYAKAFRDPITAWRISDQQGEQAIPKLFRIPGAPVPPSAAWDGAVASGVANRISPEFRYRLGYFYSEFKGIAENNLRHQIFIENEVLPRAELGVQTFYDEDGRFNPAIRVRLALIEEFADDLERLSLTAGELADELETTLELEADH
jgi:hypothetical protein